VRKEIRKLGIDILSEASWGTHLCQFYQTKEDLIDILVPYFKAGLENNEFCMWVTSEPLRVEDAKKSLKKVVEKLDDYIKKGQIEILDASQWYTKSGKFEPDKVLEGWVEKEKESLKRGFSGLRLTGNTFWLDKRDWRNFADYEAEVNNVIGKYRMIAICSYSLDKCGASEVIDVVNNHQFALIRQKGKWVLIESTERKKAEETLVEERNLLRTIIDNLPDYIYIKDIDGRYIVSNVAHARFLGGRAQDKVVGKTVFELFPRPLAEKYAADDQKVIQTGQPLLNREERSVDETGNEVWNSTTKAPLQDSSGKIIGLVGIARDITKRKKAEEALRESEERYRTLVQNVPIAVYRTIPGPKGKFLMGNPTCLKMFGLDSEEDFKKVSPADLNMDPENRKVFSDNLLAKGSVVGVELPLRKKDGTAFWGSVTARVVYNENEKNPYFDCTIMDITDRKRAEDELKKRMRELEIFQKVAVGRELKMVELKKRIKELETRLRENERILSR